MAGMGTWLTAWALAASLGLGAAAAIPPLTDAQQQQLASAQDGVHPDEGALYALLQNVMTWGAGDGSQAALPNYDALLAEPAAHRGEVFEVEGEFAGRSRRFWLSRRGPWGAALTEWVVRVRREPEQVAVVLLIDPDDSLPSPRLGQRVRIAARFYKVWGDRDLEGRPTAFLTFVARSAQVEPSRRSDAGVTPTGAVLAGVLMLAVVWLLLRARRWWALGDAGRARRDVEATRAAARSPAPLHNDLPADPAQALEELMRRRQAGGR